jgi:uncharacterized membrane protein YuzA (DUF378 family)
MRWLNIITLALAIIGGLNWGLVAVGGHDMDVVANLFGGDMTAGARVIYGLVGLSALWQVLPWFRSLSVSEPYAEGSRAGFHMPH